MPRGPTPLTHSVFDPFSALTATPHRLHGTLCIATEHVASLEQQLRTAKRQGDEAAVQLRRFREEAAELRAEKEAAVVAKEQGLIRGERLVKQLQVGCAEFQCCKGR